MCFFILFLALCSLISNPSIVFPIAPTLPMAPSYMLSAAVFKELPPLPDCVPLLPSSPAIPSVIEIPDDPEIDELISETNEGIIVVSGGPLPASSSSIPRPSRSRQVKTPCHVIPESPNASPALPSMLSDPSNSLTVSASVCRCNPTISIQPVPGPSRKRSQCEEEPPAASPPPKKPRRNKAHKSFSFISIVDSFLIISFLF